MTKCSAYGCTHYNNRETCRFFTIPKDLKTKRQWLKLLRFSYKKVSKTACICSCHFRDGKKENLPQLQNFDKSKLFESEYDLLEPPKRIRKLKTVAIENVINSEMNEDEVVEPSASLISERMEPQPSTSHCLDYEAAANSKFPFERKLHSLETSFLRENLEAEKKSTERLGEAFGYNSIKHSNSLLQLYTGLPDVNIFEALCELFEDFEIDYKFKSEVKLISRTDQILMTLMKLRQNFPHEDLQFRFKVSRATVSNIIITWIHAFQQILHGQFMEKIPCRQRNQACLPSSFCTFTNCRIILDCTEIFMTVSKKSMTNQKTTYSNYKHRNTMKALVGVAPNGVITYISDLYGGSVTDKQIVQDCGIIKQFSPGDLIIADKKFLIRDILPEGVALNIPPFLVSEQFTRQQVQQTKTIARARIHVERAIRRMKTYKILQSIPHSLSQYADVIVKAVVGLTNLQHPLIKEVEDCSRDCCYD